MTARLRTILLPLDGSGLAEAVLPMATAIALRTGAEVLLVHVLERDPPERVHGQRHLTRLDQAETYLADVAARLRAQGASVRTHVHEEPVSGVAVSLAAHAHEVDADVIAISTHGSGGMRGLLLGNIAQQTLRQSTRSVLLVRPDAAWQPPAGPARWVVALDPAGHTPPSLERIAAMARACGARLHLLTVVPTLATLPADRRTAGLLTPTATSSVLDLQARDAVIFLRERAAGLTAAGLEATAEMRRGDAAEQVFAALAEDGGDLLALFTHGRAGITGTLAGSFGAAIAGRTRLPLLLVPV